MNNFKSLQEINFKNKIYYTMVFKYFILNLKLQLNTKLKLFPLQKLLFIYKKCTIVMNNSYREIYIVNI